MIEPWYGSLFDHQIRLQHRTRLGRNLEICPTNDVAAIGADPHAATGTGWVEPEVTLHPLGTPK